MTRKSFAASSPKSEGHAEGNMVSDVRSETASERPRSGLGFGEAKQAPEGSRGGSRGHGGMLTVAAEGRGNGQPRTLCDERAC